MAKPLGFGGRDYPDFGVGEISRGNTTLIDIAELAARLGSPVNYDRQGKVVAMDTFDNGLSGWTEVSYPAAAIPTLSVEYAVRGPYCLKFATTDDSGSYSGMRRSFTFPYASRMGVEFHFKSIGQWEYLLLTIDVYDGTNKFSLDWEFNEIDNEIIYDYVGGANTVLAALDINRGSLAPFNAVKIVFDLVDEEYVYCRVNERYYDISRKGIPKSASSQNATIDVYPLLWETGENERAIWIDNFVITMDEPK